MPGDIAFHRDAMLPAQAPPPGQTGWVRWARDNLFSTWLSGVLTIGSVTLIVWIVASGGPWFWNGIWNANSLAECRAAVVAHAGEEGPPEYIWEALKLLKVICRILLTQRIFRPCQS